MNAFVGTDGRIRTAWLKICIDQCCCSLETLPLTWSEQHKYNFLAAVAALIGDIEGGPSLEVDYIPKVRLTVSDCITRASHY